MPSVGRCAEGCVGGLRGGGSSTAARDFLRACTRGAPVYSYPRSQGAVSHGKTSCGQGCQTDTSTLAGSLPSVKVNHWKIAVWAVKGSKCRLSHHIFGLHVVHMRLYVHVVLYTCVCLLGANAIRYDRA